MSKSFCSLPSLRQMVFQDQSNLVFFVSNETFKGDTISERHFHVCLIVCSDMLGVENLDHTFRHVCLFKIDSVLSSNRHKNTSWNFASFNLSKPLWPDGPWFAALRNTNRHVITVYIKTLSSSLLNQLKLVYWSFGGINMHLISAPHQPGRKRNVPLH